MKTFTVWDKLSTGVNEKCLMTINGDYIGYKTGKLYKKEDGYYHSKQHIGIIRYVDEKNNTGMYHLNEVDESDHKKQKLENWIGCYVTLESAHSWGDIKVYRCIELGDYVSSNEVEILTEQQVRQWKMEKVLDNR
jgi:hypothetical protein